MTIDDANVGMLIVCAEDALCCLMPHRDDVYWDVIIKQGSIGMIIGPGFDRDMPGVYSNTLIRMKQSGVSFKFSDLSFGWRWRVPVMFSGNIVFLSLQNHKFDAVDA